MKTLRWWVLVFLAATPTWLHAQDEKPLQWAADEDGGVPYIFVNKADGLSVGFEVDIVEALAKHLGQPIEHKSYAFDSLVSGVERADFDFAMNGLEITPDRQKRVRFTRPYYIYQLQLVARENDPRIKSLEDCKNLGLTVGTLGGSAAQRYLDDAGINVRSYDEQEGPYKDLQQNAIDAVLLDLPVALYYALPDPLLRHSRRNQNLRFVGQPFAEGYYGIAVNKNNEALAKRLDTALEKMIETGELKTILQKWELWNPDQARLHAPEQLSGEHEDASFAHFFPRLWAGAQTTVLITILSMILAVLIALPIAMVRMWGPAPLRVLAILYIEFFRGIPVLLLLYFLYYALPDLIGVKLPPLVAAVLGFGLNYAAYEAEIYRAGILAVPVGQWEAAASLGMSGPTTFWRIVMPQAIRMILPPMTNDFIALFKDTSVVSIIAVVELSKQYQILTKSYGGFVEIGLTTAVLYLIMSVPLGYLSRYLETRWGAK